MAFYHIYLSESLYWHLWWGTDIYTGTYTICGYIILVIFIYYRRFIKTGFVLKKLNIVFFSFRTMNIVIFENKELWIKKTPLVILLRHRFNDKKKQEVSWPVFVENNNSFFLLPNKTQTVFDHTFSDDSASINSRWKPHCWKQQSIFRRPRDCRCSSHRTFVYSLESNASNAQKTGCYVASVKKMNSFHFQHFFSIRVNHYVSELWWRKSVSLPLYVIIISL